MRRRVNRYDVETMIDPPDRALFRRFPALARALPIVPLLTGPTPVRRLEEVEAELGAASLWVKDDGRSAPPYGGNKPRKLEWLLGDARARGFSEFIAIGADGSNYCVAAAVHGANAGFDVTLMTMPQPPIEEVRDNLRTGAGAGATYLPASGDASLVSGLAGRVAAGALRGRRPYATWFGGSSPLGAVGFVEAGLEMLDQVAAGALPSPDVIFVPTGSVGSHAGLEVALRLHGRDRPQVIGVRVTPKIMGNPRVVAWTANRCAALLRRRDPSVPDVHVSADELTVRNGFFGEGYGLGTPEGDAAIDRFRTTLPLDPTYSGKTMAAVLAAGATGELKGKNVLFWNTFNSCPLDALRQGSLDDLPDPLRTRIGTVPP
jgi:D-cysteine desulfhydrase